MDILFFVLTIGILVFICIKNLSLIKRYKHNKQYIASYQNVFHNKENSYEDIKTYIEKEKSEEYKNKARIIKLYYELENKLDYKSTIDEIDIRSIYYTNGTLDNNLLKYNSDSFIFTMLAMAKAYENNNKDVIESLNSKFMECSELENSLEYKEVLALANALNNKEDRGSALFHSILDGNYVEYSYDKNLIGLYKRIAAAVSIFNMDEIEEFFRNDLHSFANTFIGECFLKSLGLFDIYKSVEEKTQESKQEENKQ